MQFPQLSKELRDARLTAPKGKVRMVLDTDTYNEVDDQFAVAQVLLSPDRLDCEAIYAAPFHNKRSNSPGDGMEKSYEEILRLLELMDRPAEGFALRGSKRLLPDEETPVESEAAKDLVARAMAMPEDEPLYVVAIGAISNVASALLMEPRLVEKIVVVWLGGQPLWWEHAREFNMCGDQNASRVIFNCGVPLVHIPCAGVAELLQTTVPELKHYLGGRNKLCDFLVERVADYADDPFAWSKVIWDISGPGWLLGGEEWVPTRRVPSPTFSNDCLWQKQTNPHEIATAIAVKRDRIYADLFRKLAEA